VLFRRLMDDAAVFPPGNASLAEAVIAHRAHRAAWYADMVGPLLVPSSQAGAAPGLVAADERLVVGLVADIGLEGLRRALAAATDRLEIVQIEAAVAKRGEDPQPGLRRLLALLDELPTMMGYAETPLTWGLLGALDTIAEARATGVPVAPKFRTGGLAAELFPTPVELAAVICACRDRELPFKLTAGLHHAVRYTDPETGFVHHGFLNVLAASLAAASGSEVAEVAELLAATDPVSIIEPIRARRAQERPLWIGFGSCSIAEPVADLGQLGLIEARLVAD
jgi:hypothetical protein